MPRAAIAWACNRDSGLISATVPSVPDKMESMEPSRAFRPAYRLRKTDEYSSVFAFRKTIRGRYFTLHYRPSGADTARLGVVVAKKFVRRAVQRNLLKRLARDLFRHVRATLGGHDLVLRLHAPVLAVSRKDLREDMQQLFGRLKR